MSTINFFSLGGMDENEKACYVLEIDGNYYIFNLGITIPVYTKLGIKKIIPYIDWIEKNSKLIKGIFIGVASHRNMGALQYVYDKIKNIPIYTSKIGELVLRSYLNKKSMQKKPNFTDLNIKPLEALKTIHLGPYPITPFHIVNELPDSYGFIIGTPDGNIIYIDEFIISSDKSAAFMNEITRINNITHGKNLLLITNVGNIAKNIGFTSPNHKSKSFYESVIDKSLTNRVIVGCFDTDLHTFITLAEISKEKQIPFIIYNPIFMNVFNKIIHEKMFDSNRFPLAPIHKINELKRGIILVSSTPDRLFNKLISLTRDEDEILKLKNTDKVILGFKTMSGFEKAEADILDRFSKLNINIQSLPRTILKMEASAEDHKFLVNELKPKYIIPTLGMYSEVIKYSNRLKDIGYKSDDVIALYNGELLTIVNGEKVKQKKFVPVNEVYVGNQGSILDEGDNILMERQVMSENGIVFFSLLLDDNKKEFDLQNVDLKHFGVVPNDKEHLDWFNNLSKEAFEFSRSSLKEMGKFDAKEFKPLIKKYISKQIEKYFNKTPIVIISVIN